MIITVLYNLCYTRSINILKVKYINFWCLKFCFCWNCSMVEIVVTLIIYLHCLYFLFKFILFKHQIKSTTETFSITVMSDKKKSLYVFCCCVKTLILLWRHKIFINLVYCMKHFLKKNWRWFCCFHRNEFKCILSFD